MKTAMILASGRGERLRPFTDNFPKPLYPIHGKPVIEHHIIKLAACGYERIVINLAWLGYKIKAYLGDGRRYGIEIIYVRESPGGYETGGGLYNALPYLGNAHFLTINADIYTNLDYSILTPPVDASVLWVVVSKPISIQNADFGLNQENFLTNHQRLYTFSGIAYYHPDFFLPLKPGRYSITPIIRDAVDRQEIKGLFINADWKDVGNNTKNSILKCCF